MDEPGRPKHKKPVVKMRCDMCLEEIPPSTAVSTEARDYTWYFCGLDCFERWKRESAEDDEATD